MAIFYKNFIKNIIGLIPLILLYYLCLTSVDSQIILFKNFSLNLKYIIVFYWTLRNPSIIGYGHIFLAGIITDVIVGLPMGSSALSYLIVSFVAIYVKNVTVNISLFTDWFTFFLAVFLANLVSLLLLKNFTELTFTADEIFYNSFFTILFYPVAWLFFNLYKNLIKNNDEKKSKRKMEW